MSSPSSIASSLGRDQHLLTTSWKLLMQGRTLSDDVRYVASATAH